MTILDKLNSIPPALCRLMAISGVSAPNLNTRDIAKRAGMSEKKVVEITRRNSWDYVYVIDVVKFASACGVNHLSARRARERFKRCRPRRWKRLTRQQKGFVAKLLKQVMANPHPTVAQ